MQGAANGFAQLSQGSKPTPSSASDVVGFILCTTTSCNIHVARVAVRPDFRRRGVARTLMRVRGAVMHGT